jgi:hypothetical protein
LHPRPRWQRTTVGAVCVDVGVDDASVLVTPDRVVVLIGLQVGRGGVEEDQVYFQVEQVRHGVKQALRS